MQRSSTIRSLVCFLLMAVFALGITPKKMLHNWLANHIDAQPKKTVSSGVEIGVAGYHCQLDNVVAESPFITAPIAEQSVTYSVAPVTNTFCPALYISLEGVYSAHRGPPALTTS